METLGAGGSFLGLLIERSISSIRQFSRGNI